MRLLFFSREFPSETRETRGTFNAGTVAALGLEHDVRVVSPVSWVERLGLGHRRSERTGTVAGVAVNYPTYYYPPKVLRASAGTFLWTSVRTELRQVVAEHRPDAILAYWTYPDGDVAVRVARECNVPAVVMVGGSDVLVLAREAGYRAAVRRVLRSADAVITVSDHLRSAVAAFGVDDERIVTVRRGVALSRFHPGNQADARHCLGIAHDKPIVLWAGRMVPVKGLDVLAHACVELRRDVDFRLHLVGTGPLNERTRADFAAKHLGCSVSFEGAVEHAELPHWFRAAHVTVLPSRSEGVPNVLLESIACGTPFVASHVGGIPEIADPLRDRLVPPDDPPALASALAAALTTPRIATPRSFVPYDHTDAARRIARVFAEVSGRSRTEAA
jgi:glycosyltransferase involved in cell wall biosynthesis